MKTCRILLLLLAFTLLPVGCSRVAKEQPDVKATEADIQTESLYALSKEEIYSSVFSQHYNFKFEQDVVADKLTNAPPQTTISEILTEKLLEKIEGQSSPAVLESPTPLYEREAIKAPPSGQVDLWCRIREGYGLQVAENPYIRRSIERYLRTPKYFDRFSARAQPYLYYIVAEVEQRGLPTELALLPAIESSFEPMALSRVKAAGIWQFMPGTGRTFGLKQDAWYDGRRDVIASTNAALDYLERLHDYFDGDWLAAIAAYNYGEGNIKKAIERNRARGRPTDFWSLDLPTETREFVPNLLAIAKIVANPQEYGIQIRSIADHPIIEQVDVGRQIDLTVAAKLAGLSAHDFKRLNPGYRRSMTAPHGPHCVVLPIAKAKEFKKRVAKLPAEELAPNKEQVLAEVVQEESQMNDSLKQLVTQVHTVSEGEVLENIAKRYNTTVEIVRNLNKLPDENTIKVGDSLRVPVVVIAEAAQSPKVAETQQSTEVTENSKVAETQQSSKETKTQLSSKATSEVQPGSKETETQSSPKATSEAQQGSKETKTQSSPKATPEAQQSSKETKTQSSSKTTSGTQKSSQVTETQSSLKETSPSKAAESSQKSLTQLHRIAKGETLEEIAKRYRTAVAVLRKLNDLEGENIIKIGKTLHVPITAEDVKVVASTETQGVLIKTSNNVGAQISERKSPTESHEVRKGDTLENIAKQYGTTIAVLRQLNDIEKADAIKVGDVLRVSSNGKNNASRDEPKKKKVIHTVQPGDTLTTIAHNYQVSIKQLSEWNSLKQDSRLRSGQKLTIWPDG